MTTTTQLMWSKKSIYLCPQPKCKGQVTTSPSRTFQNQSCCESLPYSNARNEPVHCEFVDKKSGDDHESIDDSVCRQELAFDQSGCDFTALHLSRHAGHDYHVCDTTPMGATQYRDWHTSIHIALWPLNILWMSQS